MFEKINPRENYLINSFIDSFINCNYDTTGYNSIDKINICAKQLLDNFQGSFDLRLKTKIADLDTDKISAILKTGKIINEFHINATKEIAELEKKFIYLVNEHLLLNKYVESLENDDNKALNDTCENIFAHFKILDNEFVYANITDALRTKIKTIPYCKLKKIEKNLRDPNGNNISSQQLHKEDMNDIKKLKEITMQIVGECISPIYLSQNRAKEIERYAAIMKNKFPPSDCPDWTICTLKKCEWNNSKIYGNNGTQQPYGEKMWQAVQIGVDGLKTGNIRNYNELEYLCRYFRKEIATQNNPTAQQRNEKYGQQRVDGMVTLISSSLYKDLGDALEKKIKSSTTLAGYKNEFVVAKIGDKKIELSRIWFDSNIKAITHTPPDTIPFIMEHVKQLYKQTMECDDAEKKMQLLGEIFWWICQAKPWDYGDPSIAELIVRIVIETSGMKNLGWKEEIGPWEEVMKEFDPKKFGENFFRLFE